VLIIFIEFFIRHIEERGWMMPQKKIKYEKPKSMDIGKAASVLGDVCSAGTAPTGPPGCGWGNDPDTTPYCPNGANATSYCSPGGVAGFPGCFNGETPVQG
jgi:hypothetical protein